MVDRRSGLAWVCRRREAAREAWVAPVDPEKRLFGECGCASHTGRELTPRAGMRELEQQPLQREAQ